jgi:GAF domain-containing protein
MRGRDNGAAALVRRRVPPSVRNRLKGDMTTDDGFLPDAFSLQENTVESVLLAVAERAVARTAADAGSVTLLLKSRPTTVAATAEVAALLDESQYEQGYGPCLDAVLADAPMEIPDMRAETRWPKFTPIAVEHGVLSSLSTPIPVLDSVAAAVNLYATKPDAFCHADHAAVQELVRYASAAIANIHLYDASRTLVEQLRTAAQSRAVIDQARGILMQMHRCTADEAFDILRRTSQHSNRKIRDIAAEIVAQVSNGKQP